MAKVEKNPRNFLPNWVQTIFIDRTDHVMSNDKKMQLVLTLSDIAEGLGTIIEALKLVTNGLDDVANLLRDTVKGEDAERNETI